MKKIVLAALILAVAAPARSAFAQIKQTREQIMFYTQDWKGERFPDGRPKLPDDLLKRALDVSIEDVWDFLRGQHYNNQFEGEWISLHPDKPFAGRAFTAQYMPSRPDMIKAFTAEGKAEGRIPWGNNNSWPINELSIGDIYIADGYGKIADGTLIGSNLGSGIAAHTHDGFVFYGGIRDAEENRELPDFNGLYKGYDPSDWHEENLTGINVPVRIGRAVVLPGDLILAKREGMIVIPAILAEQCIASAEFVNLQDAFNFELNKSGSNGGQFEGGWTPAKYAAFQKWIDANPDKLKMPRKEFDDMMARRVRPRVATDR
jgi:regulator of RNase E activity RraA